MLLNQCNHDYSKRSSEEQAEISTEDIKFMNIVDSSAALKDGHYTLGLPFRHENSILPKNHCIAEQRLMSEKRKTEEEAEQQVPEVVVKHKKQNKSKKKRKKHSEDSETDSEEEEMKRKKKGKSHKNGPE